MAVGQVGIGTTPTIDIISGGYISRGFMDAYADLPRLALIGIFSRSVVEEIADRDSRFIVDLH